MRTLARLLVAALLVAPALAGAALAQGSLPEVSVTDASVARGGTAVVAVRLADASGLGAFQVRLSWDPDDAELVNVSDGRVGDLELVNGGEPGAAEAMLQGFATGAAGVSGDFVAGYVGIKAKARGGATIPIHADVEVFATPSGASIDRASRDGAIRVQPTSHLVLARVEPGANATVGVPGEVRVRIDNEGTVASTSASLEVRTPGMTLTRAVPAIAAGASWETGLAWTPQEDDAGEIAIAARLPAIVPAQPETPTRDASAFVRAHRLDLAPVDDAARVIALGAQTRYRVEVSSASNVPVEVALAADGAPAGWSALVENASVTLAPGARHVADLVVRAPAQGASGDAARVRVTASAAGTSASATTDIVTAAQEVPSVLIATLSREEPLPVGGTLIALALSRPLEKAPTVALTRPGAPDVVLPGVLEGAAWSAELEAGSEMDGRWTLRTTGGEDDAGIALAAFTRTITFDTRAPATVDEAPVIGDAPLVVRLRVSDNSTTTTRYTLDGSEPTAQSAIGTIIALSTPGRYVIGYASTDVAGNVEPAKRSREIEVTAAAPATIPGGGAGGGGGGAGSAEGSPLAPSRAPVTREDATNATQPPDTLPEAPAREAPHVRLASYAPTGEIGSSRPIVEARLAGDIAAGAVELTVDGDGVEPTVETDRVSWVPPVALAPGEHEVLLRVEDALGRASSFRWIFEVRADAPPEVRLEASRVLDEPTSESTAAPQTPPAAPPPTEATPSRETPGAGIALVVAVILVATLPRRR